MACVRCDLLVDPCNRAPPPLMDVESGPAVVPPTGLRPGRRVLRGACLFGAVVRGSILMESVTSAPRSLRDHDE
jgi:hypothetical protein